LSLVAIFTNGTLSASMILDASFLMWMGFDALASSGYFDVDDRSLVWTGDSTTFGNKLVVRCRLVDLAELVRMRSN
jgi:hypothetical protein